MHRLDFNDLVRLVYAVTVHIVDCVGIVVLLVYRVVVLVIDRITSDVHKHAVTMEYAVTHVYQFRAVTEMVFGHAHISCRSA
jgi:hypothetical protein